MLVQVNNGPITYFSRGDYVEPLRVSGDVVICIDPSKTNMACLIGSPFGEVYSIVEFSGNNRRKGPTMDTTDYCSDFVDYLRQYLKNVNVYDAAVEKAITKRGMEHHHSNMVLTEIRGKILGFFSEEFGIRDKRVEVNNYSWKSAILPQGYRGHGEKGSKRYIEDRFPGSPFCYYFEADATDVLCIYWYKIKSYKDTYQIVCNKKEELLHPINIGIYPQYMDNVPNMRKFKYNNHFSLSDNVAFYSNRSATTGIAEVKVQDLSYEEIYKYACGFSVVDLSLEDVRVVVAR